ncbi:MAG: glycosyl hydrolase-related protein, partial [Planctomycetota bacterium]
LTLLRCVGWLSRDDLPTRNHHGAGPMVPTPEAQCTGEHRFRYAVVPFAGDWVEAGIKPLSERWRTPVAVVQGVEEGHVPGGSGLFAKTTDRTAITAVKRHRARDTLVVRLVNVSPDEVEETLEFALDVDSAWRTDLLEERLDRIEPSGRAVPVALGPHEIATVEVAF